MLHRQRKIKNFEIFYEFLGCTKRLLELLLEFSYKILGKNKLEFTQTTKLLQGPVYWVRLRYCLCP